MSKFTNIKKDYTVIDNTLTKDNLISHINNSKIEIFKTNKNINSIIIIGNIKIYNEKKFNKLQKFFWKLIFNIIIEDYIETKGETNE